MRLVYAELAALFHGQRLRYTKYIWYCDQRDFVTAKVAEIEEATLNGGSSLHEEPGKIVKLDVTVADVNKERHFENIMAAGEVEINALQGRLDALQKYFASQALRFMLTR